MNNDNIIEPCVLDTVKGNYLITAGLSKTLENLWQPSVILVPWFGQVTVLH